MKRMNRLLSILLALSMLLTLLPIGVLAEGAYMNVQVTASATEVRVGDTVEFTVTATGEGITALQFRLRMPEGLRYVANSATVPTGLKSYLGWAATDWTENSMMWTGYNDIPAVFEEGTVVLTFSCVAEAEGTYEVELFDLLPFDENFEDFASQLTVDTVTVVSDEPTEPSVPTVPSTEPTEPSTEPTWPTVPPTEPTWPTVPPTEPTVPEDGTFMNVTIRASQTQVNVGDTVDYTIYAHGNGVTALQFDLIIPEGMTYVAYSAFVPSGLKDYLGWAATDWTENSLRWTGYNDVPSQFEDGTVVLTFSCIAEAEGIYEIELFDLLPFDEYFEEFEAFLTVDAVQVGSVECTHSFSNYVSNNDATCTQNGTKTTTCSWCGVTQTVTDEGSALGHSFSNYVSNNDATCTQDGTKAATCGRCGVTQNITDDGSALGHIDNDLDYFCDRCGEPVGETPEGAFMDVTVRASQTQVNVGDTVNYTIYARGNCITALQFNLVVPEGMTYVANSAAIPTGLKSYLGWAATDWTESTKMWTGYNDLPTEFEAGTVILTFSCVASRNGTYEIELFDLLPFDENFEEFEPTLTVDAVTVSGECEHSFTNYVYNNDATCTKNGTETAVCDYCGETDTRECPDSLTGHYLTLVPATVTCTQAGRIAYYLCESCGAMFADATGTIPVDESMLGADALGHIDDDGDEACDRCGFVEEEPTTPPEGTFMNIAVKASQTTAEVGDTIDYTVYAYGNGVTAMQFELIIPEGMSYVQNSAAVPSGLKDYLGWAATDWTESSMMWTGYNALPSVFEDGTVILTFSCVVEEEGTYEVELFELLPFNKDFEEFKPTLTVDLVTAGIIPDPVCRHSFTGEWAVVQEPTCILDGRRVRTCVYCGEIPISGTLTENLPRCTGSDYTGNMNRTFPTVTVPGASKLVIHFSSASELESDYDKLYVYAGDQVDAANLVGTYTGFLGSNVVTVNADSFTLRMTTDGSVKKHGFEIVAVEYLSDAQYENIPATGHRYQNGKCSVCGAVISGTFMNVDVVPTVIDCGKVEYTVYACGSGITALQFELVIPEGMTYVPGSASVPADLKSYLGWAAADWTEYSMMWTGYNDLPSEFEEGTVILTFSCTVDIPGTYEVELFELLPFDENYEEFEATLTVGPVSGHVMGEYVYNHDATCTEDGTETATCAKCGITDTVFVEGTALGHDYRSVVTAPNCKESGYTTHTCVSCGESYTDTYVDALGHDNSYAVTKAPTTEASGTLTATCTVCGATGIGTLPKLNTGDYHYAVTREATCSAEGVGTYTWKNTTYGIYAFDVSLPKLPHNSSYAVTVTPTTEKTGILTATCVVCGATGTGTLPRLTAVDYLYTITQEATCTAEGVASYTWKNTDYGTYTFEAVLPKLPHNSSYAVTKTPTTTEAGTLTATCVVCGATGIGTLPKLNAGDYYYVVTQEATCTADGVDSYTWKNTEYGIYTFEVVVPMLGHEYHYAVTQNPLTFQEGILTGFCYHCRSVTTVTLPALNTEDYTYSVAKAATCTADGWAIYTWNNTDYGSFRFDVTLNCTGHSYDDGQITVAPTCTADGVKTFTCTGCDITYTETLAATGHRYENGVCGNCGELDPNAALLSGTVVSFGSETEPVTMSIYAQGSDTPLYTVTVENGIIAPMSLAIGEYRITFSKENHVTRTYTLTLTPGETVLEAKIHLIGDVDGNGKVNVGDVAKVYSHIRKTQLLTDEYQLLCANVNGGNLNVGDTASLYSHIRKTKPLY